VTMEKFVIISPCYNEEKVIQKFLNELEKTFITTDKAFTVIIVDDCSTDSTMDQLLGFNFKSEHYELKIIHLKFNVGHQRAIKTGLKYASKIDARGYIVMDSDGEDDPEAIRLLVNAAPGDITFVSRGTRRQTLTFKAGYYFYKILFKIISGNQINFGNYSMINRKVLDSTCLQNFDHYPAFLSRLKYQKDYIKFDRRNRIDGKSKMNYNSLVLHGLKSLLEYAEELLFFFIRILVVIFLFSVLFGGYVVYGKFISHKAIPGWSSTMALGLINSILITSGIIVLGLLILSVKNQNRPAEEICEEPIEKTNP
jgi:glycosyltransferase involved in cell wall biosynthesis